MPRRWVVVVLVAGVYAGAGPAARAAEPTMPRTFTARDVHLSPGQPLSVALHPGVEPIEVRATPPDVEVCQALMGSGAGGVEGRSWPSLARFDGCLTPDADGLIRLPSVVVPTYHVAFLVRGRDDARVDLRALRITYVPGDGFFAFSVPPFTRRHPTARFSVTPRVDHSIGVIAMTAATSTIVTRASVRLRQQGTTIPRAGSGAERGERRYGPAELGQAVSVRVGAPPGPGARVTWFVRWE